MLVNLSFFKPFPRFSIERCDKTEFIPYATMRTTIQVNQEKLTWIETICNIFPKYMGLWRDLYSQVQGHVAQDLLL